MAAIRGWPRSLPADDGSGHRAQPIGFLIAPADRPPVCRYGAHVTDQWPVDGRLLPARVHIT